MIRELALICEDTSIVSILNRLGYRTEFCLVTGNTWTETRVQHVRHTNGFPACPPSDQRLWITMQQGAAALGVSEMVVRRLIAHRILPAKQIVKFAPWMIERSQLDSPPSVKRFGEFTKAGTRDRRLAKNKRSHFGIPMKLEPRKGPRDAQRLEWRRCVER